MILLKIALSSAFRPFFSFEEIDGRAKKAGYDGIEWWLGKRCDFDEKVRPLSLHQPKSFFGKLGLKKNFSMPEIKNFANLAIQLDVPLVLHLKNVLPSILPSRHKRSQIRLEYRRHERMFCSQPEDLLFLANRLDCLLCFDVGYIAETSWNILESWNVLGSKVGILHFYDVKKIELNIFNKNLVPGQGILQGELKELLQEIKNDKWSGQITVELLPWLSLRKAQEALEFIKTHCD